MTSYDERTSVKALGMSARATNALLRNEILTIGELISTPEIILYSMRGIGVTVLNEILTIQSAIKSDGIDSVIERIPTYTFSDYLKNVCKNEQAFQIILEYYNSYFRGAMKSLGDKYNITRSRVQQIIAKYTKRVQAAFDDNMIECETLSHFDDYAARKTEIHTISSNDKYFTGPGLAYLVSNFENSRYEVFSSADINGEWLVFSDDNVGATIKIIIDDLKYRTEPIRISTIEQLYAINEDMLMSIKGIIEKQGYVTHEKNKFSTGKDRHFIVRQYLEAVGRPASIDELTNYTSLSFQQVRGAINDKEKYINVGKSIYDLVERKYEDKTIEDLAVMILTAENRALKADYLIKYIKLYKNADNFTISYSLLGSTKLKSVGDFLMLKDWSTDKIKRRQISNYSINLDEAVLEIISESDEIFDFEKVSERLKKYGDNVSHVPSSIKTTLIRLSDKKLIKRVGGARTGCYMRMSDATYTAKEKIAAQKKIDEKISLGKFLNASIGEKVQIKYKTDRVNSEKRWRTISVRGQDGRYIYTNDLNNYGRRVKYVKEKVIEFRDLPVEENVAESNAASTAWYEDVAECVGKLDDTFTLEEIYNFERDLSEKHPSNNNIRAKIRQQLQVMRDKSIIEFVAPGIYKKR